METKNYIKSLKTLLWISFIGSLLFFMLTTSERTPKTYLFTLLISLMYSFGYGLSNGIFNEFLNRKYSWTEQTKQRLTYGIIGTVIINVVLTYVFNYINFVLVQGLKPEEFFSAKWNFTNWFFINLALLISAVLHAKSFMEAWKESSKKEVIEQKIIAKSANAQFESLKNQLDPHFLFNSLNVLSALIDENPNQAQKFTSSMSKIYRYVLDQKDKEVVTVEEELDFAKTYSELLKTRFEDSVNFEIEVKDDVKQYFVVPLSLQLLLENAIKHNFATAQKPLEIKIYNEEGFLCLENNYQPRDLVKDRDGIGLSNIVQRYALLSDKNVFIEKSEDYFKVKVPLLKEKIEEMNTQNTADIAAYERATKRVEQLKGFYGSLISYCIIIPFLFLLNWKTGSDYWWAFWPMLGWGIGLIIHGLKVFAVGSDWEEKQIQKYMREEEQNAKWR